MKPKMILSILLLTALLFQQNTYLVYADTGISVVVDGKKLQFDQQPGMENGRVLVPMRAIFEALGYSVEWDGYYNSVSATMKSGDTKREVYVHVTQLCMSVYENQYPQGALNTDSYSSPVSQISFYVPLDPIQSPVKNVNGRILLPTRAIAEALGCKVDWDGASRTVIIDASNIKIVPPSNWVAAIEAHCEKYAPDFLSLKNKWNDAERKNQLALSGVTSETALEPAPAQSVNISENPISDSNTNGQKAYTVFDEEWNREFQYTYYYPPIPTSPPAVGSVPAKILIDESKSTKLFIDNPDDPYEPFRNVTDYYYGGFTYGGCNWYAAGRFWEVYGIPFPHFDKMHETAKYLDKAELYEEFSVIRDVNDIRSYSIAVFVPVSADSTPHVLFVEYVERNASGKPINVYYTEANANNPTGGYRHGVDGAVKVLAFDKFINRNQKKCIGFIVPNTDFYK